MTLEEIENFISGKKHWLGTGVARCVGISLDDRKDRRIFFKKPIEVA